MAEKYITKTKKVKGVEVSTKYRIDAAFKPKEIGEISLEFIENYCVANGETDWLIEEANITEYTVIRNKGKEDEFEEVVACDNYPFVNLRKDFALKFFPGIIKGKKKDETFKARINRLYK